MIDLIEQSTIAYDQREEWCSKLQALRIRGHSDLILHTQVSKWSMSGFFYNNQEPILGNARATAQTGSRRKIGRLFGS